MTESYKAFVTLRLGDLLDEVERLKEEVERLKNELR